MNNYDKDYDAFDIFEEIVEAKKTASSLLQVEGIADDKAGEAVMGKATGEIPVVGAGETGGAAYSAISEKIPVRTMEEEDAAEAMQESWSELGYVSENEADLGKEEEKGISNCEMYYEIEYDSCPMPGVGKFVLKPQKVEAPVRDEIRELFDQMRELARERRSYSLHNSKFYDKRVLQENSRIFYEQGMFMKDFEDHYTKVVPYSTYFPYYQMMGYEQLRTYFTWRTQVRRGIVENTSLSYAYLYLYELLGNIGVESPEEGLEKLMLFWKEYRVYDASIDKYVRRWLKDYHIYYELPHSFQEFIEQNDLVMYYPKQVEPKDNFELFCTISKYDIRKSVFYTEDRAPLLKDCFAHTMNRVKTVFEENAICFEDAIFQPVKNMTVWTPFKDALFYPWKSQRDRRVVFSEKEVYICDQNRWTFQTTITTENGKRLLGYIMKQMEVVLRKLTKYKYQLTADIGMVNDVVLARLKFLGISLEQVITEAVQEFYREATKTVVKVDMASLAKIRQEALKTQEKLIVPEDGSVGLMVTGGAKPAGTMAEAENIYAGVMREREEEHVRTASKREEGFASEHQKQEILTEADEWSELRNTLTEVELEALRLLLNGETNLKSYADAYNSMLEVLIDGINEKAMDMIGDSLLEDEFTIYEDYIEQVKGMVEGR